MQKNLTAKKIVEELNKYIISQDDAKRNVALSLRNRYRRKEIPNETMRNEIMPKNIILIGPTGVGKTEIARRLAKIAHAPFIKVEATKYTEVGYVGKDVESMIKDLVALTFRMVKEEKIESLREKYLPVVYEKIAKLVAPYSNINDVEKEQMVEKVKKGMYDEHEVEIEIKNKDKLSLNLSINSLSVSSISSLKIMKTTYKVDAVRNWNLWKQDSNTFVK